MDTKVASRIWWTFAVSGALAIVFGLIALFHVRATVLALVFVFGAFAVISGVAEIVAAVRAGESHRRWGWLAFGGLISIAAGIVCFVWPGISALAFVYLIAAWSIVFGIAEIAFALQWPDTLAHPWLAALSGVLSVVFGILLAVWPRAGVVTLTWLIGLWAIIYGVTLLYYAYRLQALRHEVGAVKNTTQRWAAGHAQP